MKLARRVLLPGRPGTSRSEGRTTHVTDALTCAGWPTGTPNPEVFTVTTGRQSSESWRSANVALASAAACASAGVLAIDACRAASRAADCTAPCAIDVRPARDATGDCKRPASLRPHQVDGLVGGPCCEIEHSDITALGSESQSDRAANAGTGAGNDGQAASSCSHSCPQDEQWSDQ